MPKNFRNLRDRIEARSIPEPNSGCWLWLRGFSNTGYGKTSFHGRSYGAHQVSWIVFRGPIPAGLLVLHRCDMPSCVNPDHLFLGTPSDNMIDCVAKGRHPNARLDGKNIDDVGASFHKSSGKWRAQIMKSGQKIHLGLFANRSDACAAYRASLAEGRQ